MGEIEGSTEPSPVDVLLADLKTNTDLAWLVERVARNNLPWVVVPPRPWTRGPSATRSAGARCRIGWPRRESPSSGSDRFMDKKI